MSIGRSGVPLSDAPYYGRKLNEEAEKKRAEGGDPPQRSGGHQLETACRRFFSIR